MGMEDVLRIDKILDFCDVPQLFVARDAFDTLYKLPAEGYVLSGEKRENVVINLPIKDRSLLAELVRKFGWACM